MRREEEGEGREDRGREREGEGVECDGAGRAPLRMLLRGGVPWCVVCGVWVWEDLSRSSLRRGCKRCLLWLPLLSWEVRPAEPIMSRCIIFLNNANHGEGKVRAGSACSSVKPAVHLMAVVAFLFSCSSILF